MNPDSRINFHIELESKDDEAGIKTEAEVTVKPEPAECAVCGARAAGGAELGVASTARGTPLLQFLRRFASCDLLAHSSRRVCGACRDLVDVLDQAEAEYLKLRDAFEAIISKNPLFESQAAAPAGAVKLERDEEASADPEPPPTPPPPRHDDSEDEPLALTKRKRRGKVDKTRKKVCTAPKRKPRVKSGIRDSWECGVCEARGAGGLVARAAHQLAAHTLRAGAGAALRDVKREDSADGSEDSHCYNGMDSVFKIEVEDIEDGDNSSSYMPDELSNGARKRSSLLPSRPRKGIPMKKTRKKRESKIVHQCDQCDAKYTTLKRLELHKEKHSDGKPPFICEVCGAHYKHKRACDIHVALHKGISDWKCEECNKLFPSKGALQRHNNIHTGKLNYQCDLCGKSFIHTSSFKMHKLSHSGVKPHACDVCGLALMTRSHLKRHKRIHSGEKRHECPVCGKRFSERYNLVAHGKAHESAGEAPPPQLPRRRLFRCAFCQERFERRYMLERHTSVAHGRTLERVPPTPRNTMSKLLKAQAQGREPPGSAAGCDSPASLAADPKEERSPEPRTPGVSPIKLQLTSSTTITASSWSGAFAAEFGLRHEFPH